MAKAATEQSIFCGNEWGREAQPIGRSDLYVVSLSPSLFSFPFYGLRYKALKFLSFPRTIFCPVLCVLLDSNFFFFNLNL